MNNRQFLLEYASRVTFISEELLKSVQSTLYSGITSFSEIVMGHQIETMRVHVRYYREVIEECQLGELVEDFDMADDDISTTYLYLQLNVQSFLKKIVRLAFSAQAYMMPSSTPQQSYEQRVTGILHVMEAKYQSQVFNIIRSAGEDLRQLYYDRPDFHICDSMKECLQFLRFIHLDMRLNGILSVLIANLHPWVSIRSFWTQENLEDCQVFYTTHRLSGMFGGETAIMFIPRQGVDWNSVINDLYGRNPIDLTLRDIITANSANPLRVHDENFSVASILKALHSPIMSQYYSVALRLGISRVEFGYNQLNMYHLLSHRFLSRFPYLDTNLAINTIIKIHEALAYNFTLYSLNSRL